MIGSSASISSALTSFPILNCRTRGRNGRFVFVGPPVVVLKLLPSAEDVVVMGGFNDFVFSVVAVLGTVIIEMYNFLNLSSLRPSASRREAEKEPGVRSVGIILSPNVGVFCS